MPLLIVSHNILIFKVRLEPCIMWISVLQSDTEITVSFIKIERNSSVIQDRILQIEISLTKP